MDRAVLITVCNAEAGLLLPPDLCFYAADLNPGSLRKTVRLMHRHQLSPADYDAFADVVGDLYAQRHNNFITEMMACAALATGYKYAERWCKAAVHTAINIHLNTKGLKDRCKDYPRIVPHTLADWRIDDLAQIDRDLLWRILATEPWLSYAERTRAQVARMAEVFSNRDSDLLPDEVLSLSSLSLLEKKQRQRKRERTTRHRIRKAFKLHNRLFGSKYLRSVLTDELVLVGHYYCYRLKIDPGDLELYSEQTNTGTPPIHITLLDKVERTVLCTLCVYFDDTPLIDYLTAILLHLKTPALELELLQTGQVQNITSAFFRDPLLPEMKGVQDPVMAPDTYITNLVSHVNDDETHGMVRRFVEDFTWEPLVEELMGYPRTVLEAMHHQSSKNPWDYILNTERVAPTLAAVKQQFR